MANQHQKDYTLIGVLSKMVIVLDLDLSIESIPFNYDKFKQIMMMNASVKPVISFERTLSEWYNNLIACEFIAGGRASARFFALKARTYLESEGVFI